jgi:hypothetical protein
MDESEEIQFQRAMYYQNMIDNASYDNDDGWQEDKVKTYGVEDIFDMDDWENYGEMGQHLIPL